MQENVQRFAEAYTAAWNSGEPEQVASFYADDGVLVINGGEPSRNRAGIIEAARGFMVAFPDLHLDLGGVEEVAGRVRYHWTLSGTNTGPGGTGRRVRISGFEDWLFNDSGLVQDSIGSFDAEDYARQLAAAH